MKHVIRHIDRALKQLYDLELEHRAEDFLLREAPRASAAANAALGGALFIQGGAGTEDLSLGIFFSDEIRRELSRFPQWRRAWSREQLHAFTVAAEEVSHFHYLLYHATRGRQLSHLELELQGEIDKFLLAFFSHLGHHPSPTRLFEKLFEQLFERFRLAESLTDEQRQRYLDANQLARRFVLKHAALLGEPSSREQTFRLLRRFYRLGSSEKISWITT